MKNGLSFRQVILEHFQHYTLAYFQAACFFMIGFLGIFVTTFKDMTKGNMALVSNWQLCAMIAGCLVPGIGAVSAFLSTTVADKKAEKKESDAKADRQNPPPKP